MYARMSPYMRCVFAAAAADVGRLGLNFERIVSNIALQQQQQQRSRQLTAQVYARARCHRSFDIFMLAAQALIRNTVLY